jgi:phosphonate transport system ATP-binding protein
MQDNLLKINNLSVWYGNDKAALKAVNISLQPGEMVALIGPSGAGKSSLLNHIAGLVTDSRKEGSIHLGGRVVQDTNGRITPKIREVRKAIGFIFQRYNLVGRLPVKLNVMIGMLGMLAPWRTLLGCFSCNQQQRAQEALESVGLAEFSERRTSTLSGGEMQRVAIARTIVQEPDIVLADEPVASLDQETARKIMKNLQDLNLKHGKTVLVSLHQLEFALAYCDRVIALRCGEVIYDGCVTGLNPTQVERVYVDV